MVQKRIDNTKPELLTIEDRIRIYNTKFPKWSKLHVHNKLIYGFWLIGAWHNTANERGITFYGAYPPHYLERVRALFPDCRKVLHLFSGVVEKQYEGEVTFDINPECNPDICGDVRKLRHYFSEGEFDLILADPPYEVKVFKIYGYEPFSKPAVIKDCHYITKKGGFLVWLDTRFPSFSKKQWNVIGTIGLIQSTNHRVRMVTIFQKVIGKGGKNGRKFV